MNNPINVHVKFDYVRRPDRQIHLNLVRYFCAILNKTGSANGESWAWDILFRGARHDADKFLLSGYEESYSAAGMLGESKVLHDLYNDHHAAYWINHIREEDIPESAFLEHIADSFAYYIERGVSIVEWLDQLKKPRSEASRVLTRDWDLYKEVFQINTYFHERMSLVSSWYVRNLDHFLPIIKETASDIQAMQGAVELLLEVGKENQEVILIESEDCPCCKDTIPGPENI